MRKIVLALYFTALSITCISQSSDVKQINKIITAHAAFEPLDYLASDELKGRSPKRPEIDVAAKYISNNFVHAGVKKVQGASDYFQNFEIKLSIPAKQGSLKVSDSIFTLGNKLLQIGGDDISLTAPIIFAGFGNNEDLDSIDVKGKIVVTRFGKSDSSSTGEAFGYTKTKQFSLIEKGALALIELFNQQDAPWDAIQHYFGEERVVSGKDSIPVFLLDEGDSTIVSIIEKAEQATLVTTGNAIKSISAKNVIGRIEGTDAKLKDQYIVLSAHYDHIGVAKHPKTEEGKTDSIYNGARDNAIGVAAVLNAARYFVKHPPKRSILFVLYTAEEMGLIGSRYFSDNPVVPLKKIIYNLNIDNAGYNDTTVVTVVGLGRTSADDDIKNACMAYGIKAIPDPAPEQNLFDRSDNLNLAVKGVPAPTFSLGITSFDGTIMKHYHQLSDEVGTIDKGYALKYIRSYVLAAKNIANNIVQPIWKKGDKYESAGKKLYGLSD